MKIDLSGMDASSAVCKSTESAGRPNGDLGDAGEVGDAGYGDAVCGNDGNDDGGGAFTVHAVIMSL